MMVILAGIIFVQKEEIILIILFFFFLCDMLGIIVIVLVVCLPDFNVESKQEREWFEWRFYAWAYVNIMRSCSSYKQICLFLLLRTKTLLHIMSLELIQIYMCINHLAVLEKWRNVTHYHITSSKLFRIWYLGSTQAANCLFSRNKQIQMHLQIYAKYEKSRRVLMKAP